MVLDSTLNTWLEKKINVVLVAGINEIQIEMDWGYMDFDYIALPEYFENVTRIEIENIIPEVFTLEQNFPNPFNPTTSIRYTLPFSEHVRLIVYNVTGQRIRTLIDKKQNVGSYSIEFSADGLASGVYFYHLEAGKYNQVKKMILLK